MCWDENQLDPPYVPITDLPTDRLHPVLPIHLPHQIDSSVSSDVSHPAFQPVFSTFTLLLVDAKLPLNLKVTRRQVVNSHLQDQSPPPQTEPFLSGPRQSQALLVLPFFTSLPEEPLAELQRALDTLVVSHFPMQSDEFARGSLHRNNYMDCVRKVEVIQLLITAFKKKKRNRVTSFTTLFSSGSRTNHNILQNNFWNSSSLTP